MLNQLDIFLRPEKPEKACPVFYPNIFHAWTWDHPTTGSSSIRWQHGPGIGTIARMQNLSATSVWPGDRWVPQTSYPRERTESANSVRGAVDIRRGTVSPCGFPGLAMQEGHQCHTLWHHTVTVRCFSSCKIHTKYASHLNSAANSGLIWLVSFF